MGPKEVEASSFSNDVREFIRILGHHSVKFLVVGGEAVVFYGHIRFTGDVDFFYDSTEDNVLRLHAALSDFWEGVIPGLSDFRELAEAGRIIQFGLPPNRIDLLNRIDGVTFSEAWTNRLTVAMTLGSETITFSYIGLEDLVRNKTASGRAKDQEDLRFLLRALKR